MQATKRAITAAAAALTMSVGGITIGASPAAAVPQLCDHDWIYGYAGYHQVICHGGTGQYQAAASCSQTPAGNIRINTYGYAWGVRSGQYSVATCPNNWPYLRNWWTNYWD